MRTFAIGDVHGHLDLLVDILQQIDEAAEGPHRIVCLGDYIDRGPASAGVIALLRERQERVGRDLFVCLKGNHEDLLLRASRDPVSELVWLDNGGEQCLASYGVENVDEVPPADVEWIRDCPTFFEDDWHYFVHAGLDPSRDRLDQTDRTRLWIRDAFLDANHDFGRYVVHGHTPQRRGVADIREHRINLDTAAAYRGPLTAAQFEDGQAKPVRLFQALPSGGGSAMTSR